MSQVRIPIPADRDGDDEPDLVSYFNDQLEAEFAHAVNWSVREFDERAQIDDLSVIAVHVDGARIQVTYQVEWSAYYGCRDIDCTDEYQHVVGGYQDGSDWVFERHEPTPPRTTLDEF